jgi:hypothetical protein
MTVRMKRFEFETDECTDEVYIWIIDGNEIFKLTRCSNDIGKSYEYELLIPEIDMSYSTKTLIKYAGDIKVIMKDIQNIILGNELEGLEVQ